MKKEISILHIFFRWSLIFGLFTVSYQLQIYCFKHYNINKGQKNQLIDFKNV